MYKEYLRLMVPFLKGLPDFMRAHTAFPELKYYGTGEADHWAVQCNQQMLGALAVMAEMPELEKFNPAMSRDELRELSLAMFRYSLRTHVTGDLQCTDGKQWGRHWISVLGLERATPGINLLEPYFTDDDRARYRALRIYESEYRLHDYPVEACMDAWKGHNNPESNIWNAGFLMRTAYDYPDLPQAQDYLKKATAIMLNGIGIPSDAESEKMFYGKPLKEWHAGANFTENFSLDHHGYMNLGYSFICLSNLALLYFNFKEKGQSVPPELLHNVEGLWKTVKKFIFPDGRLLRIGGDSRTRYNYCQCFAITAWIFAAELFRDPDAVRFEKEFLRLIAKEQKENRNGTFYGKRLGKLKDYSYFYYTRLEADPMHALSTGAYWRRRFDIFSRAGKSAPQDTYWQDDFHDAELLRTGNVVRSACGRAGAATKADQIFLCVPLDRSDMAEWNQNLSGYIGCHFREEEDRIIHRHTLKNGFTYARSSTIRERAPMGEGENPAPVARRQIAAAALPDGKTMLFLERVTMTKETTFTFGYRSLHLQIPNDVYNGHKRTWHTPAGKFITRNLPGVDNLIETGERKLNCDNALSVFAVGGDTLKIREFADQNVLLQCGMWSMYANEVCMDCSCKPVRLKAGETVYDIAYAVSADTSAADMRRHDPGFIVKDGDIRCASFMGFDGKLYHFTANFSAEDLECNGITVAAGDCLLLQGDKPCR